MNLGTQNIDQENNIRDEDLYITRGVDYASSSIESKVGWFIDLPHLTTWQGYF